MENNSIIVSICCITYNHEPFIRQCLDGFIMQKTDFPFEVLIHDDASTDNTANIIREYEAKYPNIIKPIYQTENKYSKGIDPCSTYLFPQAKSKYIAICEGDDYWIDPLKLQKQVDFMETNPDYGLVHTYYKIFNQNKQEFQETYFKNPPEGDVFERLLYVDFISTLTSLAKTDLCLEAMKTGIFERGYKMGDYPLWLYIAKQSKIGYIKDCTGVYRLLENSASHFENTLKQFLFHKSAWDVSRYYAKDTPYLYWVKFYEEKFIYECFFRELQRNNINDAISILYYIENKDSLKYRISSLSSQNILIRWFIIILWKISINKSFVKIRTLLSLQYHKLISFCKKNSSYFIIM